MLIQELMKTSIHCVKPHDTVAHARAMMAEYRINQMPVVVNRKLVGIVTDRDLRDAPSAVEGASGAGALARHAPPAPSPDRIAVEAVMTTNVLTLSPKDSVEDAAQLMRRERIGAIPVIDNGALVGILARSDVLDAFVALSKQVRKESGPR